MVADHGLPWPQLGDPAGRGGAIVRLFNVRGTPTFYLLDAAGRIAGKAHEAAAIAERLEELLGAPAAATGGGR